METTKQLELVPNNQVREITPPIDMLQYAISQNAGIETIERLMALQERNQERQAKAAFDQAMSTAKAEFPIIMKKQKVSYGTTKYSHEDIAEIQSVINPVISPLGLSYTFDLDYKDKLVFVTCIVTHKLGHERRTTLPAPIDTSGGKNDTQAIGSTVTYLQRYTLRSAFGLAVANDDDARFADKSKLETITEEQVQRIQELIARTNTDVQKFCNHAKVASIPEIPAKEYKSIERTLLIKLEKGSNNGK